MQVSRNLVIKFLDDEIDQSIPLCEKLRDKFTGPNGSGGRLELKRLAGKLSAKLIGQANAKLMFTGPNGSEGRLELKRLAGKLNAKRTSRR